MIGLLIERRLRELDLSPQTFVFDRLGYENVTDTLDYFKSLDEDRTKHPIPEKTYRDLAGALEIPVEHIRAAASESYRRLTAGWGVGLIPHANIILEEREGPPIRGFIAMAARVNTRIDFVPDSDPDTFVDQAVRRLRNRDLKRRKFHSLVINYDWDKAVRVDAAGNEIERLGDEGEG